MPQYCCLKLVNADWQIRHICECAFTTRFYQQQRTFVTTLADFPSRLFTSYFNYSIYWPTENFQNIRQGIAAEHFRQSRRKIELKSLKSTFFLTPIRQQVSQSEKIPKCYASLSHTVQCCWRFFVCTMN